MIDLHNHILPGIDDGAPDMAQSIEMARILVAEGFSGVVATPHYGRSGFITDVKQARNLTRILNERLVSQRIALHVHLGMELHITPELIDLLEAGKVLTINNGRYVLMELPVMLVPAGLDNLIRAMVNAGYKIIIAHPEKNMYIQIRPDYLFEMMNQFEAGDLLAQITADSLTGAAGLKALECAKYLIDNRLAHIIATDAHSATHRPPHMAEALKAAISLVGKEMALRMVKEWPAMIVSGGVVVPDNPLPKHRNYRWWRSLKSWLSLKK